MPTYEPEWLTRKKRIDTRLKALGWQIVPFVPGKALGSFNHHAVTEYETENGPADYALCVDGQILGIVEAKKPVLVRRTCWCRLNGIPEEPRRVR